MPAITPELFADVDGVGLGEDRPYRRGHHLRGALRDLGQHVAQEMHPAPLPRRSEQDRADGLLHAGVGVGDDQLHSTQTTRLEAAQERGPESAVLRAADGEPEHFAPSVGADAGGDHDRLGHDPVVDIDDPRFVELVGELALASPHFRKLWARHDVRGRQGGLMRFDHPQVGRLSLDGEKLTISATDGIVLVIYHSEPGTDSADKLALLASATATVATESEREKSVDAKDDTSSADLAF